MYNETDNLTQVVEKLKNGDESAFAVIYNQTYKYVYSRAKCMFSDEEEVQDLVQEVYLALYRNAANIQSSESIFGWLKTTTFYQGTKMLQKKRKEVLLSEEGEELFEAIPDDEPQIEEDYMNKEDVEVIRECINRLSDEQKTVLLAYYYDNLKVDEIADMLEMSAGTIKSRLYLARKNLQVHIETEEKKRGYQLHSFGAVTLALAIRAFLQTNMETAGSVENVIFNHVCQNLNFKVAQTMAVEQTVSNQVTQEVVKEGAKKGGKGIVKKIAQMGVKKVSLMMAGVVAATTIAGVTISNSLTENRTEDGSNSGIEETYTTTRDWRTDYARILLETYYLTEEAAEIYENDWDEQNYPTGGFFFGLLDANDDGVPELFVGSSDHTPYAGEVYMFTAGDNIKECYVGRVYSGFFENGELVQCGVEEETDYAVCKFNGKELVEKKRFELNDKVYEQYVGEFNFMLEEYWLDVDTIMSALNVEIGEKGRQILGEAESCLVHHDGTVEKIYFNDDEEPDYIFGYTYFVYMLISSGDNYTKTTFSTSTENEHFYREKESVMFHTSAYSSGSKDLSGRWLTESNEWGKSIQIIKKVYGDYVQYSYYEDGTSVEITEGEFEQKYNDMLKNVVGLFEGETYTNMSEIIDMVEFVVLE